MKIFIHHSCVILFSLTILFFLTSCVGATLTSATPSPTQSTLPSSAVPQQETTQPQEPPGAALAGPQDSGMTVPSTTQAAMASGYPVKVFFSKFPDSLSDFPAVFAVDRVSPTIMVGTYALQLLIAGPTPKERDAGYFSELNSILVGPSTCSAPHPTGGPDFILTLDKRASRPEQGTATVSFCRAMASPGIGADARISAEITATLKQFPSVKNAVILTKDGHCFGDMSGQDRCLA